MEGGQPLGDAFAKYPHIFSEVYVNMVRAGEEGGILDEILKRLALQVELDASIRKKVKSAMTYPMVLMVVTVVAFFGIMLFIVPKIGEILTDLGGPNAKLPVYTQVSARRQRLYGQQLSSSYSASLRIQSYLIGCCRYIRTPKGQIQVSLAAAERCRSSKTSP